jgi:uncharacterized membrane protein
MITLRWICAGLSLTVAAWIISFGHRAVTTTPDQIKLVAYDESVVQILESVRQDVERFFEMGVLVFGGLWAVAVVDKDQRMKITDYPELVMFFVASLLFLGCFYFLQQYDSILNQSVWDAHTLLGSNSERQFPDLLHSPYLDLQSHVFIRCFYSGMAVSGLASFSLCRLRAQP